MISVIVPTYNEAENIERCLKHLEHQSISRDEYELIVVDGGSTDGTQEIAARYVDKLVRQESNGIPGARNDGVREAAGEIIATTDADAIVPANWLERIDSHFKRESVVGVIGPVWPIENDPKSKIMFTVGRFGFNLMYFAGLGPTPGNNCAFRKDVFEKIGCYREISHHDDLEMGMRLRERGMIICDYGLKVRVSSRRMRKDGDIITAWNWIVDEWILFATRKVKPRHYARKKY